MARRGIVTRSPARRNARDISPPGSTPATAMTGAMLPQYLE
jgi:hypothetical protein